MIYTTMQQRNKALHSTLYLTAYIMKFNFVTSSTGSQTKSWTIYPTRSLYYKNKHMLFNFFVKKSYKLYKSVLGQNIIVTDR